jgi:Osmosensitive K+ channel histidine kinase
MNIGDTLTLKNGYLEKTFCVSDYVYDAQMNHTLCSSTCFFISNEDFADLSGRTGEAEYLIEAYFTDTNLATEVLVYGFVILFAKNVLRKIQKETIVDLLVTEKGFSRSPGMIFVLMVLLSFLMSIPYRMAGTIENREFVTYMGSPLCDVLIEVEQGEGLEERKDAAEEFFFAEVDRGQVNGFDVFRRIRLKAVNTEGEQVGIHIDIGENAGYGLKYLNGRTTGGKIETICGDDIPFLIAEYARNSGISKIVTGRSVSSRNFFHKSAFMDKLAAYAPDIDIYIIPDSNKVGITFCDIFDLCKCFFFQINGFFWFCFHSCLIIQQ